MNIPPRLKQTVISALDWLQTALAVIGIFAIYQCFDATWPDIVPKMKLVINITCTAFTFGFFAWTYVINPFQEGLRGSRLIDRGQR